MRAVHFSAFGAPPTIETVTDPSPSPDGVVIRVEATGLCRSDWHGWMGHDPDIRLPHVPGHELAGTVVARGARVRNWQEGARVTVPFVCGCAHCTQCASGNQQVCDNQFQPGFTAWGSFAEYVAVDYADGNLVALPDSIDASSAAALGCRFVTAFRAVVDQGRVQPGDWVAVHGCGGVGLSAIMIASAAGARVVAVDIHAAALERAREVGAEVLINARAVEDAHAVGEQVRARTGGGVQLSLDALGHPTTCWTSIQSLRKRGVRVQVGLLLADQKSPPVPMDRVIAHELEIRGSHGIQAHRYPALIEMIERGTVNPRALVARTISLDDAPVALATMDRFEYSGVTIIDPRL